MVCVDLIGRFGNNLFQIAMAVGYAEKHKVQYCIPEWKYSGCFKTVFTTQASGSNFYGENGYHYQELPFIEDVKFFGFFQSYKYFEHCEHKIRELFQFNDDITSRVNNKYKSELSQHTCSIHIRRGDYVNNPWHEVCNLQYYKDAIQLIKDKTSPNLLLVFSDDIPWCKENLSGENFLFIEGNSDIEDLYLMSLCSDNIISNSSFSWWAAWLNRNNKVVIAPSRWYNDQGKNTDTLLPKEWIRIEV